jgi:hypothetical protein
MARFPHKLPLVAIVSVIAATSVAGARVASAQVKPYCAADMNSDGRVTLQEYESWATNRLMAVNGARAQRFKELTPQRQAALLQRRFEMLDLNRLGFLDCGR